VAGETTGTAVDTEESVAASVPCTRENASATSSTTAGTAIGNPRLAQHASAAIEPQR
jgi:hypothetical protein